jgi:hypothetical protein
MHRRKIEVESEEKIKAQHLKTYFRKIDIACIIDDDPIFCFGTKKIMQLADFFRTFMVFRNGKEAYDN